MFYFAYGSNLSLRRMHKRIPGAKPIGIGRLSGHQLRFHKIGKDGTAKANAYDTDHPDHFVLGTLYEICDNNQTILDEIEGVGSGYEKKQVEIKTDSGDTKVCYLYFATSIDCSLKPFDWYKKHVLIGATEHEFPSSYIETIEKQESIADRDMARSQNEMSIY